MSERTESIYVGSAKEISVNGRDPFLSIELDLTQLQNRMVEIDEFIRRVKFKDGEHRLLKLVAYPLKPENRNDFKTHSLKIDTFIPRKRQESYNQEPRYKAEDESHGNHNDGDVPF